MLGQLCMQVHGNKQRRGLELLKLGLRDRAPRPKVQGSAQGSPVGLLHESGHRKCWESTVAGIHGSGREQETHSVRTGEAANQVQSRLPKGSRIAKIRFLCEPDYGLNVPLRNTYFPFSRAI